MAEKDLIPHQIKSTQRAQELGRLGGLSNKNNPKTIRSAKIREIKKRIKKGQLKNEDEEWLLARYESKELMAFELLSIMDTAKKHMPPEKHVLLVDKYDRVMRTIHGETIKTENVHHVINWSDMFKDAEIRLKKDSK